MKKLNRKQTIICSALLGLLMVLIPVSVWMVSRFSAQEEAQNIITVQFSQPSGFYTENVVLQLTGSEAGEILYTLDGSEPGPGNDAAEVYSGTDGITLASPLKERVYNVRAVLIASDGTLSPVFTQTYVVGRQVNRRYDVPVISIVGDPEVFWGETGILTKENRQLRGQESEREIYVSLFDEQGNVKLSQACGARIFGSSTRMKNQPSLKLFARSEYDEQNSFECVLFWDYTPENALVADSKRVVLRNGGSDNGYAHIRSEFASRLSIDAGFPDAQAASPVCVYINGTYYGAYWFVETFDESYFRQKYGEYEGQMVILENNIAYSEPLSTDDEPTLEIKEEYNVLYTQLAQLDLNDANNWKIVCDFVDIDNFLQYMAIQNYFGNADALVNNFKAYRYYSPTGEYQDGTVFDGRYRFLLFDLDETLGYGAYDRPGAEPQILSTSNRVGYDIFYNSLFRNVVSTPEGRDLYVKYYLALINYYCEPQRAEAILDEMHKSRAKELRTQYTETDFVVNDSEVPEGIDYSHVIKSMDLIKDYLEKRPDWALLDLEQAFDLNSQYTLSLQNSGEAYITVDKVSFDDASYEGVYYSEIPTVLTATPKSGDKFDYWLVDGVEYTEPALTITGDLLQDETLFVECVTSKDPEAGLLITAVKSRGGSDYIELTNFGEQSLDLSAYVIGDDPDREQASTLPSIMLGAGDTIRVYCKNYTGAEAIGQPEVNFNIKSGENVYLYKKRLIQQVYVPKLGTRDGVYRMDLNSGVFYECQQ